MSTAAPQLQADKPRRSRALPSLLAVAVLSAGVGGGAAITADRYLTPSASPTSVVSTDGTVTKVVQGNSSAPDWTVTAATASRSTVSISVTSSRGSASGSGVVFDSQGHIITNNHVASALGTSAKLTVQLGDKQFEATIVGTDPASDLAVLKLTNPPADLVPMPFADSDKVAVGDPVMAIGNPLGLSGTVTTGIVSAVDRPVTTSDAGQSVVTNAIQTSAAINPGNSGGALVNANGELVGINSAIATLGSSSSQQTGNIGIGFAIESNQVKGVVTQIIATGSAKHPAMGVNAGNGTASVGGDTVVGAEVKAVTPGGPADKAGLRVGDVITTVAGKRVSSVESLVAIVRARTVGETIEVQVVRENQKIDMKMTLTELTQPPR